jgi:hypothetical protein
MSQALDIGSRIAVAPRRFVVNRNLVLFVATGAVVAYLVLPPFFFILTASLMAETGPETGVLTFQHYQNIFGSLGDFALLLWNSLLFSIGSARTRPSRISLTSRLSLLSGFPALSK